ncbi:MAG: enoyl-CoA hydratase/isomerase family protein [Pseudobacteriovorax sp.]|nr:enoyl-CoA hydratase/isomerase family protein [Pseudobacteriovorax sp.]
MFLKVSHESNYIKWRIQRPERRNGLGVSIGNELLNAIDNLRNVLRTQQATRALVISAASSDSTKGRIWIAGGDLKELALLKEKKEGREYGHIFQKICRGLETLPIPVIFLIDGHAIGGGIELSLAGDFRFASPESLFVFKQTRIGLATGYGGATRLNRIVGPARASHWLLASKSVTATEALNDRLIQGIWPPQDFEQNTATLVDEIAKSPFQAIAAQKSMLASNNQTSLEHELIEFENLWMEPDHKRFLDSFH